MSISAQWFNDSSDPAVREGYVVRNGIDSPTTGFRYDSLGLIYLDKNSNKFLDAEDLVIGSIVDSQSGSSGTLNQDSSQQSLYAIRSDGQTTKASGLSVIYDSDFNSGKSVAPPAPKVVVSSGVGNTSSSSGTGSAGTSDVPSIFSQSSSGSGNNTASASNSPGTASANNSSSQGGVNGTSSSLPTSSTPVGSSGTSVLPATILGNVAIGKSTSGTVPSNSSNSANQSTNSSLPNFSIPTEWTKLQPSGDSFIDSLVSSWFPKSSNFTAQQQTVTGKQLDLSGFGIANPRNLTFVSRAKGNSGSVLKSAQVQLDTSAITAYLGDGGADVVVGGGGTDLIDGGAGNDIIKAGDGDDIIKGGSGFDQIWGGFGKNTFLSSKDGNVDTLYITSDTWLTNPNLLTNNPSTSNGSKVDTIHSIDSIDRIVVLGVSSADLSFYQTSTLEGGIGIGIYAKGALEAVYTGNDFTIGQLSALASGKSNGYGDIINSI